MKRNLLILLAVFILMQFIRPSKESTDVDNSYEIKAPLEVMNIFKTSCYDCHSNEIRYPWYSYVAPVSWVINTHIENGRKALNFSIWERYSAEEKKEHLKDIYRTVYAPMPLQSYVWFHDDAALTKEEKVLIRDWTKVRPK